MKRCDIYRHQGDADSGFVAIVSVLVLGAIGIYVALALLMFSMNTVLNGQTVEQSARARYLADSCAEYALLRLRDNISYAGGDIIDIGEDSCEVRAIEAVSEDSVVVRTVGEVNGVVRKVEVRTSRLRPGIRLESWQEVAEF